MKKLITLLACSVVLGLYAQAPFWTEDFGTGCNRGQLASAYTGTNGSWTISNTGVNENAPNNWFISATSSGTAVGSCNQNCALGGTTNRTLHVGNPAVLYPGFINLGADTGSTYLTGFY